MLEADSRRLRLQSSITPASGGEGSSTPRESNGNAYNAPSLPSEESNLFNPLFDKQQDRSVHERSAEPGFIGEASCAAFSNRLLSYLDGTFAPLTAGLSNYHRLDEKEDALLDRGPEFPERMHVKLLLNVARRFIGNYHPLFLEVSFMKEIDAVYRGDMMPSTLWLCKFYALMALGEIYTHRRGVGDLNRVPGTNYFTKAVYLMQRDQNSYEEPSLIQVEVLTLLVCDLSNSHIETQILTTNTGMGIEHIRPRSDCIHLQWNGHENRYGPRHASIRFKTQCFECSRARKPSTYVVGSLLF
jgi:proline utilization trans-activator